MLLEIDGLTLGYGEASVLRGVSLDVAPGSITAVLGANGAGKTTLLRSISGMLRPRAGTIRLEGRRIDVEPVHRIVRLGVAHVPEGRGVLAELTVLENLRLGAHSRGGVRSEHDLEPVFALFPVLQERRTQPAGMLSGGEQQMLAIARSLLSRPRLLMIDELSLGLAPRITTMLMQLLGRIRDDGVSVLLVEQNVRQALQIADRAYLLVNGTIGFAGTPEALQADRRLLDTYLGVD